MAVGWLGLVLQNVPWSEVIGNAPKIARGAKQLWDSFRKPADSAGAPAATLPEDARNVPADMAETERRIASLESSLEEMRIQLQSSADLIRSLADQNTALVVQLEAVRKRQLRLIFLAVVSVLVASSGLLLAVRLYVA